MNIETCCGCNFCEPTYTPGHSDICTYEKVEDSYPLIKNVKKCPKPDNEK